MFHDNRMTTRLLFLALLLFSAGRTTLATAAERLLSGRVTTPQRQAVDYAVVYLKGTPSAHKPTTGANSA